MPHRHAMKFYSCGAENIHEHISPLFEIDDYIFQKTQITI